MSHYSMQGRRFFSINIITHMQTTITIPMYFLKAIERRLSALCRGAKCDRSDLRTANAQRMARKDLRRLRHIISENEQESSK